MNEKKNSFYLSYSIIFEMFPSSFSVVHVLLKKDVSEITVSNLNVDLQDSTTIISTLKVEKNDITLFVSHVLWSSWYHFSPPHLAL